MEDKMTEIASLGEFGLIDRLTDGIELANQSSLKGVGDDAAVLEYHDTEVLVTTDLLLEGVHFDLTYVPLKYLGYKKRCGQLQRCLRHERYTTADNGFARNIQAVHR